MRVSLAVVWLGLACQPADAGVPGEGLDGREIVGATVIGGAQRFAIAGDRIAVASGSGDPLDLTGRFVVPAFIDSHVHVVFDPRRTELAAGGVAGAVDWAAPIDRLSPDPAGPDVVWSGPMITSVAGYPLNGWGRDGYGIAVSDEASGRAAVQRVLQAGATVVKVPVPTDGDNLSDEVLSAIVDEAHRGGAKVGAHALSPAFAERAGRIGADVLVHAPSGELSEEALSVWKDRALIPTLSAFRGIEATRQLHQAGATILYGTDFGNTQTAAISEAEIRGLQEAGLDGAAILASGTTVPADWFGFTDLGSLETGKQASFLVLDRDPRIDPLVLAAPSAVVHRGRLVAGAL